MILEPPTLNYVGSTDISSSNFGSNMYNILFNSTLTTDGSILMFEYKLQNLDSVTNPDTVYLNYIDIESASFQNGISNQCQISIPALNDDYAPTIPKTVQVRVYSGVFGSVDINVTPWSNALEVHNPPPRQSIDVAILDTVSGVNNLYIFLDDPSGNTIDYSTVLFSTAYYFFDDLSNNTVWQVTDPSNAIIDGNLKYLMYPNIGNVAPSTPVYTSVYAIYPFSDASANNYYSVSNISPEVPTTNGTLYNNPTITSVDYNVYTTGIQSMTINWVPPVNSVIPTYAVDHYILQLYDASGATWTTIEPDIDAIDTSYNYDVSEFVCGDNLAYRVIAVTVSGAISVPSNIISKNIFYYSTEPQNLAVIDTSYNDISNIITDMTIVFDKPDNIGCGEGQYYVITVDGNEITPYTPYDASLNTITVNLTDLSVAPNGIVSVLLQTSDTNSANNMDGAVATTMYAPNYLQPIDYQVYIDNSQDMILTWTAPIIDYSLSVVNYNVELAINDGSFNTIASLANDVFTYTYDASSNECGDTLNFRIASITSLPVPVYSVLSDTQSINMFYYSDVPDQFVINWASANQTVPPSSMNINVQFKNPINMGCGSGFKFVVTVYDGSNNQITSQDVPYVNQTIPYSVNFININYSLYGNVEVYLITIDTNGGGNMSGAVVTESYLSAQVPAYSGIILTSFPSMITFQVTSQVALSQIAGLGWPSTSGGAPNSVSWSTIPTGGVSVNGVNSSYIIDPTTNKFVYTIILTPRVISSTATALPNPMLLLIGNEAGIGRQPIKK